MVRHESKPNDQRTNWSTEVTLNLRRNVRMRRVFSVFFGLLGLWCIYQNGLACWNGFIYLNTINLYYVIMMLYGVALIVLALTLKPIQRVLIRRNTKKLYPLFFSETVTYTFDTDRVQVQSWMGESKYKWESFKEYGITKEYFYLISYDDSVTIVDRRSLSAEEAQELQQLLEQNVPKKK